VSPIRALWTESEWLDRFIALLPKEGTTLDIGCGFGEPIARYLLDRGFAVDRVDASPALIAQCRSVSAALRSRMRLRA
jgi:SAM-dependent methyltransferase